MADGDVERLIAKLDGRRRGSSEAINPRRPQTGHVLASRQIINRSPHAQEIKPAGRERANDGFCNQIMLIRFDM